MTTPLHDTATVIALPHFRRDGDALRFLSSQRPTLAALTTADTDVWERLAAAGEDGVSLATLRAESGAAAADDAVARFAAAMTALLVEPVPVDRSRRVLVIEPHSDDAALSVGATMWQRRHDTEFTVATLGSRSNFTSYWNLDREYFEIDTVTALRNAEARLFVCLLGGRHIAVGRAEAALRYDDSNWTLEWFRRHRYSVYASNNHRAPESEVRAWAESVRGLLRAERYDEVWFPLGVGTHSDHEMTRTACLRVLAAEPSLANGIEVLAYQDVPYDGEFPTHRDSLVAALRAAGGVLEPVAVPIGDDLERKLAMLGIFASQFKVDALRVGVQASATAAGEPAAEHLWRFAAIPSVVDEPGLTVDAAEVGAAAEWVGRRGSRLRGASVLRLFLVQPAGQWAGDIDRLLAAFPAAQIEVYASPSAGGEVAAAPRERVTVRVVGAGRLAWPLLAARVAVRRSAPTVVCSGLRVRQARLLARCLLTSPTLVVGSFEQFVRAVGTEGRAA